MLKAKGFGPRWINWVSRILNSASTSVLLNGVAGKRIQCKCGVRQGDPLSPLLFVIAAELLQILINQAWQNGDISIHIEHHGNMPYTIIQYVDDTLIIMPAEPQQLSHIMGILKNHRFHRLESQLP